MSGRLLGIAVKARTRAPMSMRSQAALDPVHGLDGDWRGTLDGRQVSVLFEEDWARVCADAGGRLAWTLRRANLYVGGLSNPRASGGCLSIGDALLAITGETEPCSRMEQERPGLRRLLDPEWRGGVTCRVLRGGTLRLGDRVQFVPEEGAA
ncbi:MOSC domain-containing protein [Futiania mangrovi]|uniref:MOSC domain-containing protein n=1 Tax=Futiania mangrovi TaxID=2959716 RepID=A0A9J6PI50_9PROT|nr:MOSC domain-containing protein [Futiania mangrovii]MCP1336247.1 MOSC domain-containing protein [Futiania mangrovii]